MSTCLSRLLRCQGTFKGSMWAAVLLASLLAAVSGCSQSSPLVLPEPTASATRGAGGAVGATPSSVVPVLTEIVASATPAPTEAPPTPTPMPTLDRAAVGATVSAGAERFNAAGVHPLCLRWEDVDGDAEAEWVGVYARPAGDRRLGAFVLDREDWHELAPISESRYGLGEQPVCRLDVRDVNLDGREEILVWGRGGTNTDLLHLFAWDGAGYELVASFEGNAGIRLEEDDGELGEEIVVGHRASEELVWQVVYTWDGVAYGWTWDRHAWFYSARPHVYDTSTPERAVISFYLAIDDRDLPRAFGLLTVVGQAATVYDAWVLGFATTMGVEASAVREIGANADGTRGVSAQVLAYDNVDGRVVATWWDVVWTAVSTGDGWRLQSVSSELLDSRELPHSR